MARQTESRVSGLAEARSALKRLPPNVQRRVLRAAVRAGATVLRKEVRARAPVGDEQSEYSKRYGTTRKNIRIIRLKRGIPADAAAFRVDTGDAMQAYWYEYGTRHQPARPFFRPAVDQAWQRAVNAMKERLAAGIEREARKLAK